MENEQMKKKSLIQRYFHFSNIIIYFLNSF